MEAKTKLETAINIAEVTSINEHYTDYIIENKHILHLSESLKELPEPNNVENNKNLIDDGEEDE